jgi:hypothetical protein
MGFGETLVTEKTKEVCVAPNSTVDSLASPSHASSPSARGGPAGGGIGWPGSRAGGDAAAVIAGGLVVVAGEIGAEGGIVCGAVVEG